MIEVKIPGYANMQIEHLVMDYNGTLATDGILEPQVHQLLLEISNSLTIHVVTADTHGKVTDQLQGFPFSVNIIGEENQDEQKLEYLTALNPKNIIAIGNGVNDALMLKEAAIGICVVNHECAATKAVINSDIVCHSIIDALELLINPNRLKATLRN
jgi:soluble P-type ATPase